MTCDTVILETPASFATSAMVGYPLPSIGFGALPRSPHTVAPQPIDRIHVMKPISAVMNVDLPGPTVSRHVYGHFAEHLGHCIYGGIFVGEDSPIPNVRGMRTDIVQALKAINIPNCLLYTSPSPRDGL